MVTDERLSDLVKRFGRDHAQAVVGRRARGDRADRCDRRATSIDRLRLRVGAGISARADRRSRPTATGAGVPATKRRWRRSSGSMRRSSTRCRWRAARASRFDGQARFHPRKYLAGLARAIADRGGMIFEHSAPTSSATTRASVTVERPHAHLRRHRPRDAHAADGQHQPAQRDAVSDQARALHQLRRRRPRREGPRARRAVLGYRGSVSLSAHRAASRSRRRDLRRRGSQDRPGRRHRRRASTGSSSTLAALRRRRRAHASLVGPGDRDARRLAVHRRDRGAAVRRRPATPATA